MNISREPIMGGIRIDSDFTSYTYDKELIARIVDHCKSASFEPLTESTTHWLPQNPNVLILTCIELLIAVHINHKQINNFLNSSFTPPKTIKKEKQYKLKRQHALIQECLALFNTTISTWNQSNHTPNLNRCFIVFRNPIKHCTRNEISEISLSDIYKDAINKLHRLSTMINFINAIDDRENMFTFMTRDFNKECFGSEEPLHPLQLRKLYHNIMAQPTTRKRHRFIPALEEKKNHKKLNTFQPTHSRLA